jgi:FkbM family methyltransferase
MYSQNDEERHILRFFGGFVGRFLDVGAHDGRTFSNTRCLAERGWSGVCIEPSPTVFPALAALYADEPSIECCQLAVAPFEGCALFHDARGGLVSTFDQHYRRRWQDAGVDYDEVEVDAITWESLLGKCGREFDFINLDVEAMSAIIFDFIEPLELPRLKLMCVEHDFQGPRMIEKWKRYGFRLVGQTSENVLLGRWTSPGASPTASRQGRRL